MNENDVETYFLWLTEAEQSDLFDYEDRSIVQSLICESVMEQHNSLPSDYDYVDKPLPEYSNRETIHVPNMNPESTHGTTTYSYSQDIIPANLFYSAPGVNQPYQTMNQNSAEFNAMYYGNHSKEVESVNPYSVQSTVMDPSSIVPSAMNYIESNAPPVVEYNTVSSLTTEMQHVPSNPMSNCSVATDLREPSVNNMDPEAPSKELHIASVLLDVPLEQLNNNAVPIAQELPAESINFNSVSQEMPMIPDDTKMHFNHERLHTLQNESDIASDFEQTVDNIDYHDDSSRSMVIDENPQLSINYEIEDQTVLENAKMSDSICTENESLSTTYVANEIAIEETQPNTANEVISSIEDKNMSKSNEREESPPRTVVTDEKSCEVTSQVNGTIYETENEIPIVQMCIRNGCANPAVNNPEWEQEFCSNDCVVIHCRNVFDAWVEANTVMSQ